MHTLKCQHCGGQFQADSRRERFCSPRCAYRGHKIASFHKWKPATYDYIPNHCNMAMLIFQQGDAW
jgi:hypothetical protein